MRISVRNMALLLGLTMAFTACEKREPDFFDGGANGAYFDYGYATDFDRILNFSDYIVGHPDTVDLPLKLKLLGYLKEESRTLAIKTKPIEGYALADVTIDEVIFSGKEYEKTINVKVCRPEKEDSIYAICIYLDGSGDLGTGINGRDEVNLYVTESYEMPVVWYSHMTTFLGGWSKEKHIFLAQHTGDNQFYANLYDEGLGMHLYDSILALNVNAVNSLLATQPQSPVVVNLPILKESDYPDYAEPYFWNQYEEYLGMYRTGKFCRFTTLLGGSNTRDVAALFASEEGQQKMEEKKDDFHKEDVLYMLNQYYEYAKQGIPLSEYKEHCWVEMRDLTYDVRIPYWWEVSNGLGTDTIVKKYFGEYGDDKYRFMLQTMLKEDEKVDEAGRFVAASILPFIKNGDSYAWDPTPLGVKQLVGEERLKECYRIIKAANDRRPASRKFDIPEVELEN